MIDTPRSTDAEIPNLTGTLRRYALPILGATALAGVGAYVLSDRQPKVYEATSSVIGVVNGSNTTPSGVLSSPPPPSGALDQALHGPTVVQNIIVQLRRAGLPSEAVARIKRELQAELSSSNFQKLHVEGSTDAQQLNVSTIHAQDSSPDSARALANAAMLALQQWDVQRVQRRLEQTRANLQQRLNALDQSGAADTDTGGQAIDQLTQDLATITALGAAPTLDVVSDAVASDRPIAPKPTRSAVVAALLALLAASGLAVLLDALRRRVYGENDLLRTGVPLLGRLPRLSGRALQRGVVSAARDGLWYEGSGFLRINVLSQLPQSGPRRIVVSSARVGEGKSSVTVALAEALATGGMRVLVVDADPYRPGLSGLWQVAHPEWHPIAGVEGVGEPINVRVARAAPGVDLLPAVTAAGLGPVRLAAALERWSQVYDAVLIDTPPLLALADAATLAARAEGIVMVIESGVTGTADLERALNAARTAGARVLGVVLNKAKRSGEGRYVPDPAAASRETSAAQSITL